MCGVWCVSVCSMWHIWRGVCMCVCVGCVLTLDDIVLEKDSFFPSIMRVQGI